MAKSDIILIDGIIKERLGKKNAETPCLYGEELEKLAIEQLLKDFDLSKEELESGHVDGKDDGGIDGIYIFVNGNIVTDIQGMVLPKRSCEVTVYIITCKHADTFSQAVLNSEYATISELFDLSKNQYEGSYNVGLLNSIRLFRTIFERTASCLDSLKFEFFYVSRGDTLCVGDNIVARGNQISEKISSLFSKCTCNYRFIGSSELLELYRNKPVYDIVLPYREVISHEGECSIALCDIQDYFRFITDDNGDLKKYLFDSNVRDYIGINSVNEDIMESLSNKKNIDFWWLNNGITILSTSAVNIGRKLKIQNVQIVNGLQTSHTIYKYMKNNGVSDGRCVMVKVITQNDAEIRDEIIRSTNNQTAIQSKSLYATDKIQRDIEDIMRSYGFYYERRLNFYTNQGVDKKLIFDILYLAAGYVALVLKSPRNAINFKQKSFRNNSLYDTIFNSNDSLIIWPKIAKIMRATDEYIMSHYLQFVNQEKALKRIRYHVAFIAVSRLFGNYNFSVGDIAKLDINKYTDGYIEDAWNIVRDLAYQGMQFKKIDVQQMLNVAADKFQINGLEEFMLRGNIYGKLSKPIGVPKEIRDKIIAAILKEHSQYSDELVKSISETTGVSSKSVKKILRKHFNALQKRM